MTREALRLQTEDGAKGGLRKGEVEREANKPSRTATKPHTMALRKKRGRSAGEDGAAAGIAKVACVATAAALMLGAVLMYSLPQRAPKRAMLEQARSLEVSLDDLSRGRVVADDTKFATTK